jgi:ribosomal-protein-alanine N-acetyltransferase
MAGRMIRRMLPGEREAVANLFAAAPESAQWSAEDLSELEESGAELWVATEAGQVTGAVAWREAGGEAEILNVAVAVAWRRKGIGGELMAAALREAAAQGGRQVFLEVRESNAGARMFYFKLGFAETGRRRSYYRDPSEDALLLSRTL